MAGTRGVVSILAKAPSPGRVKSRLWSAVGRAQAAELAQAFLVDVIRSASRCGLPLVLATDDVNAMSGFLPAGLRTTLTLRAQGVGELDVRLERVLAEALGEYDFVIAIGADSPDLPREHLERARAVLQQGDGAEVVVGPAFDGGFYLFGTRVTVSGLFDRARLGGPHALQDTRLALDEAHLRSVELDPWWDVDDASDLAALIHRVRSDRGRAPATAACLEGLGLLSGMAGTE